MAGWVIHPRMSLKEASARQLLLIHGKGGVGKSVLTEALVHALAAQGRRVLWVVLADPRFPLGERIELSAQLSRYNASVEHAFQEYIELKIGVGLIARVFANNKLVRFLAEAGPGFHELILMGKIWHERQNYDHVVVDMPSTGFGLAMVQSVRNFEKLFKKGPVARDAAAIAATLSDAQATAQILVTLPEETPIREALELRGFLLEMFPTVHPTMVVNRVMPAAGVERPDPTTPIVPRNAREYAHARIALEQERLRRLRTTEPDLDQMPYLHPHPHIALHLSEQLLKDMRR